MEKMEFPWLKQDETPPAPEPAPTPETPARRSLKKVVARLRPYSSQLTILTAIVALSALGRCASEAPAEERAPQKREAAQPLMMSLVAIPKGHPVYPETLSEVNVRAGSLSRAQRLRALTPEHLPKLNHAIVAKKDIPPQTPIFWSDLMLKPETRASAARTRTTRVFFDSAKGTP